MADGSLTYKEFMDLPEKERVKQYINLSDADKFKVRQSMVNLNSVYIPCNDCVYYRRKANCDAFPDGIPREHINAVIDNPNMQCSPQYHFIKK